MCSHNQRYILMSVFYRQRNWHLLLEKIKQTIVENPFLNTQISKALVFLSLERGPHVRLALQYRNEHLEIHQEVVDALASFLKKMPSDPKPSNLAMTYFFSDFPVNELRYNLFKVDVVLPGPLLRLQEIISLILLAVLSEKQLSKSILEQLVMKVQASIFNALCNTELVKQKLCIEAISRLKLTGNVITDEMIDMKFPSKHFDHSDLIEYSSAEDLFSIFERAVRELYTHHGRLLNTYFTVISVVQLHLFKVDGIVFYESLQMMHNQMPADEEIGKITLPEFSPTGNQMITANDSSEDLLAYVLT